ncbi:MAG: PASTA domain-containing protein [Candidatus Zixiibacteriota bacterium]|nr:MAG: PASTA domain-containing protein [candidate division Zixibacteria bacterium]
MAERLPHGSRQRKIVLWVAVPLVVFALFVLVMDKLVMPLVTRQGSEFPLPDFAGQRLAEAKISLEELDLNYEIASEEYSADRPAGTILGQIPGPNNKVKPGRTIKFTISQGMKAVPIPELAGKSVRQAMLELEAVGLKLGEIAWALSDTLPERVVVFSYPAANTEIPLGSHVNLMVMRGRASGFTYMPNVVGLTIDEARKNIEDKALRVGLISYRTDENYLPETVMEQSEPHGAELDVGTEIDLVLSTTE